MSCYHLKMVCWFQHLIRHFVILIVLLLSATGNAPRLAASETRIAFGSCFKQAPTWPGEQEAHQDFWAPILAEQPHAFIFAGDNVYADSRLLGTVDFDKAYGVLTESKGFQDLNAATRVLATWDDHDYGKNDGGRDFGRKAEAEKKFEAVFAAADPERDRRPGVYDSWIAGGPGERVQVILLDTRYFRSPLTRGDRGDRLGRYVPSTSEGQDMLGGAQWTWLARELKKPADVRLIVSSIQVLAEANGWERWGNLPKEQARLFDLLQKARANGVIFLSGDRQRGAIYQRTDVIGYPLLDVTSSSLNKSFPPRGDRPEPGPHRLGEMVGDDNYGLIRIDWATRRIDIEIKTLDGATARRVTIGLDALTPPS